MDGSKGKQFINSIYTMSTEMATFVFLSRMMSKTVSPLISFSVTVSLLDSIRAARAGPVIDLESSSARCTGSSRNLLRFFRLSTATELKQNLYIKKAIITNPIAPDTEATCTVCCAVSKGWMMTIAFVGLFVGMRVGIAVGEGVGTTDGLDVGINVGVLEGLDVGVLDG